MPTETERTAQRFTRYQDSLASRLRYEQAQHNMEALHDLERPLRVLDAAGGNGLNTEWLLERGHSVTLLDSDPDMLDEARARMKPLGLFDRCELVLGTLEGVSERVPHGSFDLILCHHAIEYSDQSPKIFRGFHRAAAEDGELSLITLNPVSEVIRAVVFRRDAALAQEKLSDLGYDAKWFGQATLYPFEQIREWAEQAGWGLGDFRAIRVLADYISEEDGRPQASALIALEEALAHCEPYRRFGRYLQFCLQKDGGSEG